MHIRIVFAQVQPGKADELIQVYRDSIGSALKQQPGFKGALLLINRNTCKSLSIAIWETEADLKASETSGFYQAQIAKIGGYFVGTPHREDYEVGVQM